MSQQAADDLVVEADELFRAERYADSANRYERATQIFPPHALAWKGLGHSLLCLGRPHDAARAFDQAIGLRPDSATALWGGAVAHAEIGNKVMAKNYLLRTLALQPTWAEMAHAIPQLAQHLQTSSRAADALRGAFGSFSTRTFRHTGDEARAVEIGRVADRPRVGQTTYATIGLSNHVWFDAQRPRVELVLATLHDAEVCPQILANLAFHLADTNFFPEPGVVVRDVVGALHVADLSTRLPHIYITVPRAWSLRLPIDDVPPPITLAQAIPISEPEYAIWKREPIGFAASFLERGIDPTDLRRPG